MNGDHRPPKMKTVKQNKVDLRAKPIPDKNKFGKIKYYEE
jgi:hypothetical protein